MHQGQIKAINPSIAKRYSEEEVYDIFDEYCGNVCAIVAALQCTPRQLEHWFQDHPERRARLEKSREYLVLRSERALIDLLEDKDPRVRADIVKFVLQNMGRSRGWHGNSPQMVQTIVSDKDKGLQIRNVFGLPEDDKQQ